MKNTSLTFFAGVMISLVFVTLFSFKKEKSLPPEVSSNQETIGKWQAPPLPQQLSFAGEEAPITREDIKEKFDKEFLKIYYSQGTMLYLMKLANKNFPIIEERLKANGVPLDFKYVCIAESNMQSWARSRSGAVGYWQFMQGTASGYGLETNSLVDERRNLAKATDAACKYFKTAKKKFGNWTAAAASFNCGIGGYHSRAAFQKTNNYYELYLPEETNKYILRILSFKYIMENAEKLGYSLPEEEKYHQENYSTFTVKSSIPNLAEFALDHGTTYKILHWMNPWIKGHSLSVKGGKTYTLKLPEKD